MASDNQSRFGFSLEQLPWVQRSPGMREKVYEHGDRRFRIVEFTAAFREPDWCVEEHVGYVLDGEIDVLVDGHTVTYRKKGVVDLPSGTRHRHNQTVETATLFLIETSGESS
ncbi:MAG TPA: cupin domain-containing protein [Planctomycetaceae bacterium]|nr:cupin domain-containing protein [Planctomycetaceae bacterium]